jgi:putative FmdB family regulatory protein
MPTYDYECGACGHKFEKYQSITAKPIRVCPACGQRKVKRLIGTGSGVIFKGSGFYQTDYRSSSYREAAKKDKPAGDSASAAEPSAKPAAKTENSNKPSSGAKD